MFIGRKLLFAVIDNRLFKVIICVTVLTQCWIVLIQILYCLVLTLSKFTFLRAVGLNWLHLFCCFLRPYPDVNEIKTIKENLRKLSFMFLCVARDKYLFVNVTYSVHSIMYSKLVVS